MEKKLILHLMRHGLGDAVQFTAILQHLAAYRHDWENHVVALVGKHTAYRGMAARASYFDHPEATAGFRYYHTFDHAWCDLGRTHARYPSTKAVNCLLHDFAIEPDPSLLRYRIEVGREARERVDRYVAELPQRRGLVAIHYQGNTSPQDKNLDHACVLRLCRFLTENDFVPIILDWDRRSPIPDGRTIFNPDARHWLWNGWGTGCAETIAALIDRCTLFVGIDSGPQKVAMSRATRAIGVWTRLHPVNFADLADNILHLVPKGHKQMIRGGGLNAGFEVFQSQYESFEYEDLPEELVEVVANELKISPLRRNPMARSHMLKARSFHSEYYEEHRQAGLDYLGHGEWQENYGRWLVESLELRNADILDVGCACGSQAYGLQKAGCRAHGIDLNNYMIELGKKKFPVPLYVCDAVNLHLFGDCSFDCVHSNQSAEHWRKELVPFILHEFYRVLKPGGLFWAALDTMELFERQQRNGELEDPTNQCIERLAWWHEQLKEVGFEDVRPTYRQTLESHPLSFLRRYDWDWWLVRKPW